MNVASVTQDKAGNRVRLPRIAVVGCGYWGKNLVRNFSELGALEALVDSDAPTLEALVARHGGRAASLTDVLRDATVAAVAIAAPASSHFALAKAAIEAGKHVLVEKPLALEVADAEALCALAERHDRRLMVGHLLQYHPAFRALEELVRAGHLGRIRHIASSRLNFGLLRREEDVLWSFAPHDISMVLALAGEEPETVTAVASCHLQPGIADIATVHLGFPGGVQAQILVSWLHPVKEQKLTVVGEHAMAVFDDGEPWERKLVIYRHRVEWRDALPRAVKAEGEPVALEAGEPLRNECRHFLDCVTTGAMPRTDGREGLRVLSVLARASASLDTSRRGAHP